MVNSIADNLTHVRHRMEAAARQARRDHARITLVAVSKAMPGAFIREAFTAGQRDFGESYVQELKAKADLLTDLALTWHFIGHLQRNKAGHAAAVATTIHSLDSFPLAEALHQRATRPIDVFIEVNLGNEASKSGVATNALLPLARHVIALDRLRLRGLMGIPPFAADPEQSRPHFRRLRLLHDELQQKLGRELPDLSMGMSHDFEVAIAEGATIVRVGTAIFGERTAKI